MRNLIPGFHSRSVTTSLSTPRGSIYAIKGAGVEFSACTPLNRLSRDVFHRYMRPSLASEEKTQKHALPSLRTSADTPLSFVPVPLAWSRPSTPGTWAQARAHAAAPRGTKKTVYSRVRAASTLNISKVTYDRYSFNNTMRTVPSPPQKPPYLVRWCARSAQGVGCRTRPLYARVAGGRATMLSCM